MNMKASWLYAKNPVVVDKDLAGAVGLKGLLLKGNLSSSKFDKTSWYSINDDKLGEMMNNAFVNGGRKNG